MQTFLLASLMNRPRMRLSKGQLGAILWLLRQLGHLDVPSLKGFQKLQEDVRQATALPTLQKLTPTGKVFSRIRIPDLICMVSCIDHRMPESTLMPIPRIGQTRSPE